MACLQMSIAGLNEDVGSVGNDEDSPVDEHDTEIEIQDFQVEHSTASFQPKNQKKVSICLVKWLNK